MAVQRKQTHWADAGTGKFETISKVQNQPENKWQINGAYPKRLKRLF